MAMTNAERQRKFRANRDKDLESRQSYLNKQKQKYKEDKLLGKKKCKIDMTTRELRAARKQWKEKQRKQREKIKKMKQVISCTPPDSPLQHNEEAPGPSRQQRQNNKQRNREKSQCYRDKVRLEGQLSLERKKTALYKKRWLREKQNRKHNQNTTHDTPRTKTRKLLRHLSNKTVKKTLVFHHALVDQLKNSYTSSIRKSEKKQISRILAGSILRKYRMKSVAFKLCGIGIQNKLNKHKGTLSRRMCKTVHKFFERDDVSRMAAGKKNTVTDKKVKKQRRILGDSLKNLHVKYCAEYPIQSLSYTTFCRLRPFWVKFPNESDRNTCQCKTCENTKFMANSLETKQVIETSHLEEILNEVVCDPKNKECMYNNCHECKEQKIKLKNHKEEDIEWCQWITKTEKRMVRGAEKNVKLTTKEKMSGSVHTLLDHFQSALVQYKKHTFNIRAQFSYFKQRKESLKINECLIHVDFSENYVCKMAEEIHSMHFGASKKQISLHTGVYYMGNTTPNTFCTVSDNLCHEPGAIWAHLQPILDDIKRSNPQLDHIEFFSDGPTTQYRQKANFFLLSTEPFKLGIHKVVWNFFESGHGKGTPDAVGGSIKRKADTAVKYGSDITSAASFVDHVIDGSTATKLITTDDIIKGQQLLHNVILKVVPGTMTIHQIVSSSARSLLYRDVSCYCDSNSGVCMNHSFKSFEFEPVCEIEREHEQYGTDKPVHDKSTQSVMSAVRTRGKTERVASRRGRKVSQGTRLNREVGLLEGGDNLGVRIDDTNTRPVGEDEVSTYDVVEECSMQVAIEGEDEKCQDKNAHVVERQQAVDEVVEECGMEIEFADEDVKCQDNNVHVVEKEHAVDEVVAVCCLQMAIKGGEEKCQDENAVDRGHEGDEVVAECGMDISFEDGVMKCHDNNIHVVEREHTVDEVVEECGMAIAFADEVVQCHDNNAHVVEREHAVDEVVAECCIQIEGGEEKCQDVNAVDRGQKEDAVREECGMQIAFDGDDKKCQDNNDVETEQAGGVLVEECGIQIAIESEGEKCQDNNGVETEQAGGVLVEECGIQIAIEKCQKNAVEAGGVVVEKCSIPFEGGDAKCLLNNVVEDEQMGESEMEKHVQCVSENEWQSNVPCPIECVGKYVIIEYQRKLYPGYVQNVSGDEMLIKCMKRVGSKIANCFTWPKRCTDISWYDHGEILAVIPKPKAITGLDSHFEVCTPIWNKLLSKIGN